jgi:hypothetical protein
MASIISRFSAISASLQQLYQINRHKYQHIENERYGEGKIWGREADPHGLVNGAPAVEVGTHYSCTF